MKKGALGSVSAADQGSNLFETESKDGRFLFGILGSAVNQGRASVSCYPNTDKYRLNRQKVKLEPNKA